MITARPRAEHRPDTEARSNRKVGRGVYVLKGLVALMMVLNVLLLYGIVASPRGVRGYRMQQAEVLRLGTVTKRLSEENQRLVSRIRYLKADSVAQERLVKQELGWVRDDEVIIEFAAPLSP